MLEDDLGMGMCEMTCTLNIRADLISGTRAVPYKYYIVSPGAKRDEDKCYEVLCGHYGTVNRCLKLENNASKGTLCVYFALLLVFILSYYSLSQV